MDPHVLDNGVVAVFLSCGLGGGGRGDAVTCRRHACTGGRTDEDRRASRQTVPHLEDG